MTNDGYHYRLIYWLWDENPDGSKNWPYHADDEYHDMTHDRILSYAQMLRERGAQVALLRKPVVPQPPWERLEIPNEQ